LSVGSYCVQSCHAVIEASKHFGFTQEHPSVIVCEAKNEETLLKFAKKLQEANIGFKAFQEPDIGNQFTALATEPVFGDKRLFFKNFQLLKGDIK
jgi:hypothetical protein